MKCKRFLAAAVAAVMALSLIACGGTPAETKTASTTSGSAQATAEGADPKSADYYDSGSGVVIWQRPELFKEYEEDELVSNFTFGDFSGSMLGWAMVSPDESSLNYAYMAVVFGSSDASLTQEDLEKQMKENDILENDAVPEVKELTTRSGQKVWVEYMGNDDGSVDIVDVNGEVLPEQKTTYETMYQNLDDLVAEMGFVEPVVEVLDGKVEFKTVDLDGNPVDSSVFVNSEYTMINVWGSFCAPCIGEMEDLMKMDAELENVQIITILGDATSVDDETAEDAREVVQTLNLTLPVYLTNDDISAQLPVDAYPTSFMVDSEGNLVGTACVGAVGTQNYKDWIQSCIEAQ